ncbi:16S rRNA (cytosine(1402)-N(4))-methyltransferase RsmH [Polynucleobacter sp. 30F-ANTBAC]|jgi:16S rRNA (cytosine1402-N4)-methyltransferase|uniref:16S rRNA (cytosine(1402)-N(4))-methyltransferase RsmH n=1 Tax=Polynucleobacter sp. 30F-ANTBAC TaxID=2689095 RepID=UPI001C0D3581|nr:16S rRNA (cytosine(1402)-N(4))-methyltransferase RsmH [Polynucleobacter sp. 30F-ANTBAC]MBU3599817.1 16S rRNA (cytosine(1402)-N(4))-methyltransferase RsmH [Polynucleobacter sp. 30F-ANTBAC]
MTYTHRPVLLAEAVTSVLGCSDLSEKVSSPKKIIDGTFGRGGHSRLILEKLSSQSQLIAFDKDLQAIAESEKIQDPRFQIIHQSFASMAEEIQAETVDGILLDLGISSPQIDDPGRGFSFRQDGPLDMRMDTTRGISAAEWLATAEQNEIARVIKDYGEERFAVQIAKAIITRREQGESLTRTGELAALVASVVRTREAGQDPATRTFQAIRIYINQELTDLENGLRAAFNCLKPGGLLAIISFHSLEDRIVKQFMQGLAHIEVPRGLPLTEEQMPKPFAELLGRIKPSTEEVKENPRSRSAILRVMRKIKSQHGGHLS